MEELSVCMIVKNEEKHLENCLNSIKNFVDEIIIIDTGSNDKTKEIAKKFTNKIFDFKWNNNFSDARNFSLSKATKEWILSLDADEIIAKKDMEKIKKLINTGQADSFLLNWRNYTNDIGIAGWTSCKNDSYEESKNASGFNVEKVLRLFKNKKEYYFEGKIHETPHNSIKKSGGTLFDTDLIIHHLGSLDKQKFTNKKDTYIRLLKERLEKKDFVEKPKDFVFFELGRELWELKHLEEAIYYFEKAVEIKEDFRYLFALGGLYIIDDKLDEAEKVLKKANELNPRDVSINNNLGVIYARKKEFNKAIRRFEKAIDINPKFADAYFNLGKVYKEKGKKEKMNYFFIKAIELNPSYKKKIIS